MSDILNSIIAPNIRNTTNNNQLISTEIQSNNNSLNGHLFAFDPIQSTFQNMFITSNNASTLTNTPNEIVSSSASVASSSLSSTTNNLLVRTSVIISLQDVHKLLIYLKQILKELPMDSEDYKWLKSILPNDYLNTLLEQTAASLNTKTLTLSRRQSDQNLISLANYTNESNEVVSAILKEPESIEDYKVLIVNINDKAMECPGMMSEEKLIKEYETIKNKPTMMSTKSTSIKLMNNANNVSIDSTSERVINKVPSYGMMIMDRDDMNSVEGGISEACETNRSLSSNDSGDEQIDKNDDDKNLSDFENFSGRDTPIISGHDTSSSHSQEDLHNISGSNQLRPNISNVSTQRVHNNHIINNSISQSSLASNIRNIPVTVQKANREDINDKFCKFEINKSKKY